jgi:hypothetical protein
MSRSCHARTFTTTSLPAASRKPMTCDRWPASNRTCSGSLSKRRRHHSDSDGRSRRPLTTTPASCRNGHMTVNSGPRTTRGGTRRSRTRKWFARAISPVRKTNLCRNDSEGRPAVAIHDLNRARLPAGGTACDEERARTWERRGTPSGAASGSSYGTNRCELRRTPSVLSSCTSRPRIAPPSTR